MSWSFRLMNDAGTLNIPLNIVSREDNRYIGRALSEKIEETWTIQIQGTDWADMDGQYTALSKAMYDADRAIRLADEPRYVWLESTRPDATQRRTLIYSGSFGTLAIQNTDTFDQCSANVAWTFLRHPLAEALTPVILDRALQNVNPPTTVNEPQVIFMQNVGEIATPTGDGEAVIFPTEAPGRIAEFSIKNTIETVSHGGSLTDIWAGFQPLGLPYDDHTDPNESALSMRLGDGIDGNPATTSYQFWEQRNNSPQGDGWLYYVDITLRPPHRGKYKLLINIDNDSTDGNSQHVLNMEVRSNSRFLIAKDYEIDVIPPFSGVGRFYELGEIFVPLEDPSNTSNDETIRLYFYLHTEEGDPGDLFDVLFILQSIIWLVPIEHSCIWTDGKMRRQPPSGESWTFPWDGISTMTEFVTPDERAYGISHLDGKVTHEHITNRNNWHIPAQPCQLTVWGHDNRKDGDYDDGSSGTGDRVNLYVKAYPRFYSL